MQCTGNIRTLHGAHLQWFIVQNASDISYYIIIFASDFEEKMHRLRAMFDRICDAKLKLKPAKCIFFQREVS